MINYAHRGASEYAPENTLSSFYLGLLQGANGIETDVQKTADSTLVLFHDDTVDRVTDGTGKVENLSFSQLRQLKVIGNSTCGFYDRIMTYQEFLERFSQYDIHFAIELKGADVEAETLALTQQYGIMDRTTFTSFEFSYIERMKALCPNARVGWLLGEAGQDEIRRLQQIGGEEMAPMAQKLTSESVAACREAGLGVRAWGISSVALMKKMCALGVDGMTVNFPDRLFAYLSSNNP